MTDWHSLQAEFARRFTGTPHWFRAPGRVNLIGEHTDYNLGFVMPAAIEFYTTVAIGARSDGRIRAHSTEFDETIDRPIDETGLAPRGHWSDYVMGVALTLRSHGVEFGGADLLIHGEVPLGAGLSSSAALEVAVALAITETAGRRLGRMTLAGLCQRAENEYVGARCGIMDQFASACGRAGSALLLDCRALTYLEVPLPEARLVICNSMVRHSVAAGEYNRRRAECELGVRQLSYWLPGTASLRDVALADLEAHAARMDSLIAQRCRHVLSENMRVLKAATALDLGDLSTFGRLMGESHRSLRDDYQVSCRELDLLVALADEIDGVYGSRMTGGGFGGCTVTLVRPDAVERFRAVLTEGYSRATGRQPETFVCSAADGAARVDL